MERKEREKTERDLRESLRRLEAESWTLYLKELRRLDAPDLTELWADDWDTPMGQFLRSDAGTPLGVGMPSGEPIAGEQDFGVTRGVSHIERWKVVLRQDPCAYCGRAGGSVDHVDPQSPRFRRDRRQTHTWLNMTGACQACNSNKAALPLLLFMRSRAKVLRRRGKEVREAA